MIKTFFFLFEIIFCYQMTLNWQDRNLKLCCTMSRVSMLSRSLTSIFKIKIHHQDNHSKRFPACEHSISKKDELKPWIPKGDIDYESVLLLFLFYTFRFQVFLEAWTCCKRKGWQKPQRLKTSGSVYPHWKVLTF